jgi:hypothetical protein
MRLQRALAVGLDVVGIARVEQQRHVAEQVVKDVGLDDVVELGRRAYPVRHREFAVGQQREKRHLGDQPRHAHQLPARGLEQPLVDVFKARDRAALAQAGQGLDKGAAGQPGNRADWRV